MNVVRALTLTGFGLNCDVETAHACALAGASADRIHINALIDGDVRLEDYQLLVFGGGFSWGDDHGAGVIQAVRMKTRLGDRIMDFVENGNLALGICNGFQTLVNMGLLPGFDGKYGDRTAAVTYNDCGNFRDDWVTLAVNPESPCVFTKGMETLELPVRHGEGKFFADEPVIRRLLENNHVAVRYALPGGAPADGRFPHNPNGSIHDIAGICDETGRVFGLMPHPEAYNHPTNHPDWTRRKALARRNKLHADPAVTPGVQMFVNAVTYLREIKKI